MKNLKYFKEFITESSDYRNVTGNGSSGGNSSQNAGPSFNKGPMSAIYRLPTIVGVETEEINDPYFNKGREPKRKKIRKNKNIEKNRKQKSKYLDTIDTEKREKLM